LTDSAALGQAIDQREPAMNTWACQLRNWKSLLLRNRTGFFTKNSQIRELREQGDSPTSFVSVACDWQFSCASDRCIETEFMLRIQKSTERNRVVFSLSGRIEAEDVAELGNLCRSKTNGNNLVLDLVDVMLVNRDAIKFLADCEAEGATLRNCPAYIREWISKERGK
jgi:hypothetical protein